MAFTAQKVIADVNDWIHETIEVNQYDGDTEDWILLHIQFSRLVQFGEVGDDTVGPHADDE